MKKIVKFLGLAMVLFLIYYGYTNYPLDLISGFSAKSIASGHFIDNRSQGMIENQDNDVSVIFLAKNKIDEAGKFTIASVFGLKERKAIYREGLGATLINEDFDVSKPYLIPKRTRIKNNLPFPYGDKESIDSVFVNIDYEKLNKSVDNAFDKNGEYDKKTRAVLVIYKDKIIAEHYSKGFNKNSKILGWSMTKSV